MKHKPTIALCANLVCTGALSAIALATLSAHAQTNTYSTTTGGSIPDDNAAGISSTINVPDQFDVGEFSSVTVRGLIHTWVGDLVVTLSHNGKTVDIFDRVAGNNDSSYGDDSDLDGSYTFVSRGGADFTAAAAAVDGISAIRTDANYATAPVGFTSAVGSCSTADGQLTDFAKAAAFGA